MSSAADLRCDGCGQVPGPDHFVRRFARLELTTRYRPIHIQELLLGAVMPEARSEFLYAADGPFEGEAAMVLAALGISTEGKTREGVLTDIQKRGLLLIHVLECPVEGGHQSASELIERQLPATLVRVRRSLKPKKVLLVSEELLGWADRIAKETGCSVSEIFSRSHKPELR